MRLLVHVHKSVWDMDRSGEDALNMVQPAIQLSLAYRSKEHIYSVGMNEREQCVKVVFGEVVPWVGQISPWATQMLSSNALKNALFYYQNWPMSKPVVAHRAVPQVSLTSLKYQFEVIDECLCMQQQKKKKDEDDEPVWVRLASFHVVKVLDSYKFFNDASQPTYSKLLVRHELDSDGDGVVYFKCDDIDEKHKCVHKAQHAQYLEMEIMFSLDKINTPTQLAAFFAKQNPCLSLSMNIDQWMCYATSFEVPMPHDVISHFGKQDSGIFVAGNCAFHEGRFMTHKQANVAIIPQYFGNSLMPLHKNEYPRHLIIPFPHVRYIIGSNLFNHIMPRFFENNMIPATAVFAMSVMGLHADLIWKGKAGIGHGMPFAWIYSTEPNTGKTEAATLAHSMLGMFKRQPWAGDATKPALFERLAQQANLTVVIDDVVVKKDESQAYAQLGRSIFDQSTRAVCSKARTPLSSAMFTSNNLINTDDAAFQSRCLPIKFDKLVSAGKQDSDLYNDWMSCRELISALTPDFESLLLDGGLDHEAIMDCASFMQIAVSKQRDRNANLWGLLLYYMLNVRLMFQASCETLETVVHWVVTEATRHSQVHFAAPSLLEQFVLAVARLRADTGTDGVNGPLGLVERTIFWDKLRTSARPVLYGGTSNYISVRVEPCLKVIELVLGKKMNASEIYASARGCDFALVADGPFYDVGKGPWPIARLECDPSGTTVRIPCMENDPGILEYMSNKQAIFFVRADWDRIVAGSSQRTTSIQPYKNIIITSALDRETYNFYHAVTGRGESGWFGYRSLAESSFAYFAGMKNQILIGSDTTNLSINKEVEKLNMLEGNGSVTELYEPNVLLRFFGYEPIEDLRALPSGFTKYPLNFASYTNHQKPPDPLSCVESEYVPSSQGSPQADKQTKVDRGQDSASEDPSSSPARSEFTGASQNSSPQPLKKRQKYARRLSSCFIDSEGEEDEGEGQETQVSSHIPYPKYAPVEHTHHARSFLTIADTISHFLIYFYFYT